MGDHPTKRILDPHMADEAQRWPVVSTQRVTSPVSSKLQIRPFHDCLLQKLAWVSSSSVQGERMAGKVLAKQAIPGMTPFAIS